MADGDPSEGNQTVSMEVPTAKRWSMAEAESKEDAPAQDAFTRLQPGDTIGKFVVVRSLGQGGMGLVFLAQDPELLREVALKVLRPEKGATGATSAQARMLREAQAMAMLSHPHLVGIYEVGLFEEHVFLAMEYVIGHTLEAWLESDHPLEDVMQVFDQAGRALAAIHGAGLVHRDFKPDNVMVTPDGVAKVLDLGIARKLSLSEADEAIRQSRRRPPVNEGVDSTDEAQVPREREQRTSGIKDLLTSPDGDAFDGKLTAKGSIVGTPEFMAPEQLTSGELGPFTDQFSFAIALFRALTGVHPFPGENYVRVMTSIMIDDRRAWPDDAKVPEGLRRAIDRALSPKPKDRWPSMAAFLDACQHGLGLRGQIRFLTSRWTSRDRDRQYLLPPGALLDEGTSLLRDQRNALSDEQAEFILASERRARKRKVQRRFLVGGLAALVLGMLPTLSLVRTQGKQLKLAEKTEVIARLDNLTQQVVPILMAANQDLLLAYEQRDVWMRNLPAVLLAASETTTDTEREKVVESIARLNDYFRPLIERRSMISSLMIARDDDLELLFFQDRDAERLSPPYSFYNRLVWPPELNASALQIFWKEEKDEKPRSSLLTEGAADSRGNVWRGYRPTERVWFKRALAEAPGTPSWTAPYLFFVTKDAGVTASIQFRQGGHTYVFAVDFMLTDLSMVTTQVGDGGFVAAIVTKKGQVIGLPSDSRFDSEEKVRAYFSHFNDQAKKSEKLDAQAALPTVHSIGGPLAAAASSSARQRGAYAFDFGGKKLWAGERTVGDEALGISLLVAQTGLPDGT